MSRRIDIELTSARPDGTWTWRAAGAREPKGILDGSLLPTGARTGSILKAEAEMEIDGMTITSVTDPKGKVEKSNVLELIPSEKPFEPVTSVLAKRERGERSDRGDRRDRPPRRDGRPGGDRPGSDRPRSDRGGEGRPPRTEGGAPRPDGGKGGPRPERRGRPNFTPPPELPQRPKAKRLKPGRVHRNAVLADLPEEQRPVAERALQGGIPAVRQAVQEQNARLKAEGKEEIPAAGLLSMAEQLLPTLRVAEWLDRADAAKADLEELDLRDLRSVVASSDDPMVARDETTRAIAAELREALVAKQEKELQLWFGDIEAAIAVGRTIRALKLSSQPPKAGVRFPPDLAKSLAESATTSLTTDSLSDRWSALLEAAAFSPVRAQIVPTTKPEQPSDELLATVKRLAPLLPQIAALFDIEVPTGATAPKPLRPTRPAAPAKKAAPKPPPPPKAEKAPKAEHAPKADKADKADEAPKADEAAAPVEVEVEVEAAAVEAAPEPEAVEAAPESEPEAVEPASEPEPAVEDAAEPEPAVEAVSEPESAEAESPDAD